MDRPRPSTRRLKDDEVERLLALDVPARLATLQPDGFPRVTPIWFLWEAGAFYMTSVEGAPHLRNLRREPRAGICVDIEAGMPVASGVRPNASVKAWGMASLKTDTGGQWTRRITLKYVSGDAGLARAEFRAQMDRVVIELRPGRLLSAGTLEVLG